MIYPKASAAECSEPVPASPRFPRIEEHVLAYWEADDTFRASVENRPSGENGDNEFVFYDGPPFANGLPHYGHLLTGYVKDLEGYAKLSLKKYSPIAARNDDLKVFRGRR